MMRMIKVIFRILLLSIPAIVLAVGAGVLWLSRSVIEPDGAVVLESVAAEVEIVRDENGVPHISAETIEDAARGLGFAHAQDRMWQMEVSRMAAQGRLSELFGGATVSTDIWLRTMGIRDAAISSLDSLDAATLAVLEAYSEGVNGWLESEGRQFSSKLPPEYVILRVEPEPWTPADSVSAIKMMSVTLAANVAHEANRLAFAALGFSQNEISDLYPAIADDTPPTLPDLAKILELEPISDAQAARPDNRQEFALVDALTGLGHGTGASNNWVVGGSRTESGAPVLANDPHLGLAAPSLWYLAHMQVEDEVNRARNLIGATLPGTPYVLLGRNDHIAWGFTNTGTDVQDIFIEKVNPDNEGEYLTPSGWEPFGQKQETIVVSGGDNVEFTRRWTRHGPVLPRNYRNLGTFLPDNMVAALQWISLAGDDTTPDAAAGLWDMKSVEDFQAGMRSYVSPMQSMVIADRDGNIGLIAPGRVPVRNPGNQIMGRAPVPGWNSLYDWRGTIPFDELPRQLNPESGAIGTANTKIVAKSYPHFLTFDWEETHRQERVDELVVNATDPHSPAISAQVQADVFSRPLLELKDMMLDMVEDLPALDGKALQAVKEWDGQMRREDIAPTIFTAWMRQTMIAIYKDDLGPAFDGWFKLRADALTNVLKGNTFKDWCDVKASRAVEDCGALVASSLTPALNDLRQRYGEDRSKWRWGFVHKARGKHRPFSQVGVLAPLFDVEVESGGGQFTLDRGAMNTADQNDPFGNHHAASFRGIYDLSDLDRSTYMQTTGQSGNIFSGHYRDLASAWANVEGIEISSDAEDYSAAATGTWVLKPQ